MTLAETVAAFTVWYALAFLIVPATFGSMPHTGVLPTRMSVPWYTPIIGVALFPVFLVCAAITWVGLRV